MLNEYTRTYKANGKFNDGGINRIDVRIDYRKGADFSFWDGKPRARGYYFSIHPYKLIDHGSFISHEFVVGVHGSGSADCILPCERQSKKRFETACQMIDELTARYLPGFLAAHGIELESDEYAEEWDEKRV